MDEQVIHHKIGDNINLDEACDLALLLAQKGLGKVEPNPCVGAVVIDEVRGKLISYGYHEKFGQAHAEVNALKGVKEAAGLTMVVTLEPCSHFGKTPPCADFLVSKKISKLVYFDKDPNPEVAGRGLERLKSSGIEVVQAPQVYSEANQKLNDKYFYAMKNKKSFVHLKWAQSLDGKMGINQKSKWITSENLRGKSHFLRAQSDAILIGRKTLEQDNPSLNVRLSGYEKPLKVLIYDTELKLIDKIKDSNLLKANGEENIYFISQKDAHPFKNILINHINELPEQAFKLGIQSIYVEGGAYTLSQFIKEKLFNKVSIFIAPKIIGKNGEGVGDYLPIDEIENLEDLTGYVDFFTD